ncbi:ABATE domain-containing protein [Tunturiibacter gelidiferens]|uniref:ABATE domain-containing protein n=1 Tax=Tunturiibacter gelidiferens TaxID=3069689 RepID=UPI003D9BF072
MKDTTNENHLDFVGDDLAINFINTRRMVEGQLTDTLQSDSDVKTWLRRLEVPVAKGSLPFGDGVLLKGARELREIALAAVQDRKSGKNLRWSRSTDSWRTLRVMQRLRHTTRGTFV